LRQQHDEIAAHGGVILVIAFEASRRVGEFCRRHTLPFLCLVDERRTVYADYGMGRASWWRTLTPRALAPYIRLAFSRRAVPRASDQDIRQRGGDFVVGPDGRIRLAHVTDDPADRPGVGAILAALER
jgi:peroxiredoxin